jgi:hypothetical protein
LALKNRSIWREYKLLCLILEKNLFSFDAFFAQADKIFAMLAVEKRQKLRPLQLAKH